MSFQHQSAELNRMQALSQLSITMSETLSLNNLLYKAVTQCIEILNFDAAIVYFMDEKGEYFVARHFYGISQEMIDQLDKLPVEGIGGLVVKNGKSVVTSDLKDYYHKRPQIAEFKSVISVPIKVRKKTIGVLDVLTREHRNFEIEDIWLVEFIGLQLGVASENARMFESIENVTIKLKELVIFNQKLSACMELDTMIRFIITDLEKIFKSKVIFLTLTKNNNIHIEAVKQFNRLTLAYDESIQDLLSYPSEQVNVYSAKRDSHRKTKQFLRKMGFQTAIFVNFHFEQYHHCLVIGKGYDYDWNRYELEVMEGISKSISLGLYKGYYFMEMEKREKLNADLLKLQVAAQEEERQRIAQELHDSINQSMVGIHYHLQYCREELERSPKTVGKILDKLIAMTKDNIYEIRQIIYDLHPIAIKKYGFLGAVEELVKTYAQQGILNINMEITGEPVRFTPQSEIYLYRVIQECFSNILKHAQVDQASLYMCFDPNMLTIIVRDQGVGFDSTAGIMEEKAFGLIGMKKRIDHLGGKMKITSKQGEGTTIEIQLPIDQIAVKKDEGRQP